MNHQNYIVKGEYMNAKQLGLNLFNAAKPGLQMAAKDMIIKVIVPEALDPILNKIKQTIPGTFDDVIIEGFRPKAKEALIALAGKI